jgi:hypothetical protein
MTKYPAALAALLAEMKVARDAYLDLRSERVAALVRPPGAVDWRAEEKIDREARVESGYRATWAALRAARATWLAEIEPMDRYSLEERLEAARELARDEVARGRKDRTERGWYAWNVAKRVARRLGEPERARTIKGPVGYGDALCAAIGDAWFEVVLAAPNADAVLPRRLRSAGTLTLTVGGAVVAEGVSFAGARRAMPEGTADGDAVVTAPDGYRWSFRDGGWGPCR